VNGIELSLPRNSNWLSDAGYEVKEQEDVYDQLLDDVIANPRWYLDQLSYLAEFRVSWVNYAKQNVTRPYRFTKRRVRKDGVRV